MNAQVLEKLRSLHARYEELMRLVSDPAVQADPPTYRTHTKALAELEPLVDRYQKMQQAQHQLDDAREMAASGDAELKALADEEIKRLEPALASLFNEAPVMLIPKDPNDDRNVVLEIRAGTGGDEAALFAGDLFRMYQRYADNQGWRVELLHFRGSGSFGPRQRRITNQYGLMHIACFAPVLSAMSTYDCC